MPRSRMVLSEYRSYELPPDFPVLLLTGEEWRISPVRSATLHFHNCVEIGYCQSGQGRMTLNMTEQEFHAGDVTLIGSHVHHTTWSSPDSFSLWSYLFVDLDTLLAKETAQRESLRTLSGYGGLILHPEQAAWAAPLMEGIIRELQEQADGYRDCIRGLLLALAARMIRLLPPDAGNLPSSAENPLLTPAITWIREQYAQDATIGDLAALCHLSPTHFRRLFREQLGTTPLDFLHQVRVSASCSLLLSSEDSIASIAGRVGYASLSCFNRHFLQIMGIAPSRWRKTQDRSPHPSTLTFTGWTRAETTEEILRKK